jgi:uncharacterized membrane protein YtjA (UPF0391 family)
MFRWSIGFFIASICAATLGFSDIAVAFADIGKVLFFIFLTLFVIAVSFRNRATSDYLDAVGPYCEQCDERMEDVEDLENINENQADRISKLVIKLNKRKNQIVFWQGKFTMVKNENNKIRRFNQQLAEENMELQRRLADTINQASSDQANYTEQIMILKTAYNDMTEKAADTVRQSS